VIRTRRLKRIKVRTPGGRRTIHFKKFSKTSLRASPKISKEKFKAKVRA
jgi:ribosomal protein L34E